MPNPTAGAFNLREIHVTSETLARVAVESSFAAIIVLARWAGGKTKSVGRRGQLRHLTTFNIISKMV